MGLVVEVQSYHNTVGIGCYVLPPRIRSEEPYPQFLAWRMHPTRFLVRRMSPRSLEVLVINAFALLFYVALTSLRTFRFQRHLSNMLQAICDDAKLGNPLRGFPALFKAFKSGCFPVLHVRVTDLEEDDFARHVPKSSRRLKSKAAYARCCFRIPCGSRGIALSCRPHLHLFGKVALPPRALQVLGAAGGDGGSGQ